MGTKLLGIAMFAFLCASIFAFRKFEHPRHNLFSSKDNAIVRCGPDWESIEDWIEENDISPMPGAGTYKWKISTKNDSAQFYFNQGINMYYAFHIIEALASFKKAIKFDSRCGMLHWAEALAYGPNINDLGYAASPEAAKAAGWAIESPGNRTEKEEMLIRAQRSRYSFDSTESRAALNQVYVDQMKQAYDAFPNDPDVAALYADALMLQHPWDLWNLDGTPKPWTPLIRELLEKILKKYPNHPGANHYYIHVMEPSPFASLALPSADRLGKLSPGLAHVVHMPSHIYLRAGQYARGVKVNEDAARSYRKYLSIYSPVAANDFLYIIHALHMQTNHAMLEGRRGYSEKSARETQESIAKDYLSMGGALGNYVQYLYMTPTLIQVKFGEWGTLLKSTKPAGGSSYAFLLYRFGLGMAKAAQSRLEDAKAELKEMEGLMKDSTLFSPMTPFSAAIEGAKVARSILEGSIALKEKNYNRAIASFKEAVSVEENMVYNEPRDWFLNPKHYLADAYLKAGQFSNAATTSLEDLKNNNENGWALFGLYQALKGQKKNAEAAKVLLRYKKAFVKADIKLNGPVF